MTQLHLIDEYGKPRKPRSKKQKKKKEKKPAPAPRPAHPLANAPWEKLEITEWIVGEDSSLEEDLNRAVMNGRVTLAGVPIRRPCKGRTLSEIKSAAYAFAREMRQHVEEAQVVAFEEAIDDARTHRHVKALMEWGRDLREKAMRDDG